MAVLEVSKLRRVRRLPRIAASVLVLVALAALAAAALAGRALLHRGEVMPGVQVLGTDVGGLSTHAAEVRIERLTALRLEQPVQLRAGVERISVRPSELLRPDARATAAAALAAGRESWSLRLQSLLAPLTRPIDVEPRLARRPGAVKFIRAALSRFVARPVSARVSMDGLEPVLSPSRPGRKPDLKRLLSAVQHRVLVGGAGAIPVHFGPSRPAVGDAGAQAAADEVKLVVSAPVALTFKGQPVGTVPPDTLASLLVFRPHAGRLLVLLDEDKAAAQLAPAVQPFTREPVNASFSVDGTRARVVRSHAGLGLSPRRSATAVLTAAHRSGDRTAALALHSVPARLRTADAKALGIHRRISSFTTDMGPSSFNRIHNVHLMADYIDGTIVRPGAVFSFNERVGPRTTERGFLEGQMIVGSLLLPSIGGGVCQTATTLFNNAFDLGLPILERTNHSFYISHYPLGRDATVSWGGPDLKFRNDLKHAILIKSSYTDSTLTFTFYGADQGRRVTARTSDKTNWQQPKKTYALDPAAPAGSVRYVGGSQELGFDVTVYRTVSEHGEVIRKDSFTSHYIPVGDTVVYGPGSTIPGPYFVIPAT